MNLTPFTFITLNLAVFCSAAICNAQANFKVWPECNYGCDNPSNHVTMHFEYSDGLQIATSQDYPQDGVFVTRNSFQATTQFTLASRTVFINKTTNKRVAPALNAILLKVYQLGDYCQTNNVRGTFTETGRFIPLAQLRRNLGLGITPIAPRGEAAGASRGDGFAAFYANFKRAVLSNDRAAVQNMMSPVFLMALGDEYSPDKALRYMDWQQLRVVVNRFPVFRKQCACYGLNDRRLGSLSFIQENDQWKWKGLQGD
jgi:hypothetical protein